MSGSRDLGLAKFAFSGNFLIFSRYKSVFLRLLAQHFFELLAVENLSRFSMKFHETMTRQIVTSNWLVRGSIKDPVEEHHHDRLASDPIHDHLKTGLNQV